MIAGVAVVGVRRTPSAWLRKDRAERLFVYGFNGGVMPSLEEVVLARGRVSAALVCASVEL
jgi:hypothetical protein